MEIRKIEYKKLEIKPEGSWLKRKIASKHFQKSLIYIILGALAGFLYYYFTQGQHMESIPTGDIVKSILIGGFFGFFITNSPCARGKC